LSLTYLKLRVFKSHFFNEVKFKKKKQETKLKQRRKWNDKKKLITSIKPSSGSGDSLIKWIDSMKISHFNTAPFSAKQSRRKQKAEMENTFMMGERRRQREWLSNRVLSGYVAFDQWRGWWSLCEMGCSGKWEAVTSCWVRVLTSIIKHRFFGILLDP
jgi:hypothetical protein